MPPSSFWSPASTAKIAKEKMPFDVKIAQTCEGPKFVTVLPPAERRPNQVTFFPHPWTHKPILSESLGHMGIYEQIMTKQDQGE